MNPVKQFITQMRDLIADSRKRQPVPSFCCTEDLVLCCGSEFEASPRPQWMRKGVPKECFMNAAHLAFRDNSLIYCEGYGMTNNIPIPLPHAWVCHRDDPNVAIDNTWPDGAFYFGVRFNTQWLANRLLEQKTYGVLQLPDVVPLLENGLPVDAVKY